MTVKDEEKEKTNMQVFHTENLTQEEKLEQLKKIYAKNYINFPSNSGVSGIVFNSGKVYYSNNASKETNF